MLIHLTEAKRIIDFHRQHPTHISPLIDGLARLLVSLIGVLLVLVPTIVLSYLTSLRWILVSTFMFTIAFSVAMSLISKASNEQMIMATAAYGAVLVVFVANRVNNGFKE
jgi:VIT1/CCC1 family predicted Fe2+/Mn2+ transporter